MAVTNQDDGLLVRRRKCTVCGHGWFTAQQPEFLVPAADICYVGKKAEYIG